MTVRLVTDSNAQVPAELAQRFAVEIVPLPVTIDGVERFEGVDLTADEFYRSLRDGSPQVTTSQPSPGAFVEAYQRLVVQGATEIVSIHLGSDYSGTVNSARLAARAVGIPVLVVDTGVASFGISCCVWEAADALSEGATANEAVAAAERVAAEVSSVFVVEAIELARASGRFGATLTELPDGVPVLLFSDGKLDVVGSAHGLGDAAEQMASAVRAGGAGLRVAIGIADESAASLTRDFERRVRRLPNVVDLVRYRVGPSVAASTGPGTAGAFWYRPLSRPS